MAYARSGWPVFPLRPREKTPRTTDGFKSATTDRDAVLAWWSQWPDSNVGLRTGIVFDVLDIDGPEGRASLTEYLHERGIDGYIHSGPVALTGKGVHLLFQPTGEGNRAGMRPKLDFRGAGGYIVAAPSIHPLGHAYRWDEAGSRTERTPLPPPPSWLTDLVHVEKIAEPPKPLGIRVTDPATGAVVSVTLTTSGMLSESRPDIIAVALALGLTPVSRGHYWIAQCPFHDDSTPSMALYPAPQDKFHCYGCSAHGDSHDLERRRDMEGRQF